jgi:hypothetical protein
MTSGPGPGIDVGISDRTGTDVAMAAAPVTFDKSVDLRGVPRRPSPFPARTLQTIRQTFLGLRL